MTRLKKDEESHCDDSDADVTLTDRRLEALGYKSELRREFTYFSAFSFAVSVSGLFGTVATTFIYPLMAGGSASVIWCWAISGAGCLCIAFSVAELVSSYPTSGGLYYVCSRVFPKKWAPFVCWVDGWMNLLGQIAGVASSDYGAAQIILAGAVIGTDGKYVMKTGHVVGVMAAVLVFQGIVSCLPTRYIEKCTKTYVVFHYACLIAGAVALLACTHNKHDASYVFTHIESNSGWSPIGFSFLFGFLSVSWTMTDYDATAHICEEMDEPEKKAPWAISMAMLFTYVTGFLYNIVLCFCMGDPQDILNASQPVIQIYYNSLGKAGGLRLLSSCSLSSTFLGSVLSRHVVAPCGPRPVTECSRECHLGCTKYQETISAIFNVCAVALDWSYCIPIFGKLMFPRLFEKGPWNLGKFSVWVNWWACLWTLFASIIFFMPTEMPVTKENMNYCVVFFVFVVLASVVCWYCGGRRMYLGPMATAQASPDDKSSSVGEIEQLSTVPKASSLYTQKRLSREQTR
nr:ST.29 [Starmerella bombicola]